MQNSGHKRANVLVFHKDKKVSSFCTRDLNKTNKMHKINVRKISYIAINIQ